MNYNDLPKNPGVYLFKDKDGQIIYIGKAKNLKKRVSSYFTKDHSDSIKTNHLVSKIKDIDFIIVDNEIEALLLENRLIKNHKPRYNILLKDSKTYAYLKITNETYPKLVTTRVVTPHGKYFGPYTNGYLRKELFELTVKLFKLRICKTLPKRECLNYHIGICTAPCIMKVSKEEYNKQVNDAIKFLNGNTSEIINKLKNEMKTASSNNKFEIALEKKRNIEAIETIKEKQKVDLISKHDQDVIVIKTTNNKSIIDIFSISKGVILGKKEFSFEYQDDLFSDFIKMYYLSNQNYIPNEIIVSEGFWEDNKQLETIENYLSSIRGLRVSITNPKKGDKKALVNMALKNATYSIENDILLELQSKLNLSSYPKIIECFDISNLGYDYVVAGMTRWVNGKPDKSGYRKFEIKSFKGKNDDFASMKEVIHRRYKKLHDQNLEMPNLIIIDGGLGQLNSALESLKELGLTIPIISLAKKEEEIYIPEVKEPFRFNNNSRMMLLVRSIRDSVHNYVLSYNRKKRDIKLRKDFEM